MWHYVEYSSGPFWGVTLSVELNETIREECVAGNAMAEDGGVDELSVDMVGFVFQA